MSSKKNKIYNGIVYSTDSEFSFDINEEKENETLPPQKQILKIELDTKNRSGKKVTLITGFIGTKKDLENLSKQLKNFCGAGGSCDGNSILIQGDFRKKINDFLISKQYKTKVIGL